MKLHTKPNRKLSINVFEKIHKDLFAKVRAERTYKMPPNYIDWQTISGIASICLATCGKMLRDASTFTHSYRFALWFVKDAPIYCLTSEIIEAFDQTDALHKPGVLANWKPSLPSFLLAIPKGLIYTPDGGEIDYLLVSNYDPNHPEWQYGKWKHGKVEEIKAYGQSNDLYFQIVATDSKETVWISGTAIDNNANLIYSENANLGSAILSDADREFIARIRNLVINVILALDFSPNLITEVSETECKSGEGKGFAIDRIPNGTRYPRWLGKDYKSKSDKSTSSNNHSSPCNHWRRGHWRLLESGNDKRWRESKRIWIEPVFVNS